MDFIRKLFFRKKEVVIQPIIVEEVNPPILPTKKRPTILIMDECSTTMPWNEARKRMNFNRKE